MRETRLLADIAAMVAVAEAGSFTQGGRLLGLTPSGASRSVSRLEERIGTRLLDRTTRSLRLTDAGRKLHSLARPHLTGLEEAAAAAGGAAEKVSGRLRVAINPIVLRHILAPNLARLAALHPGLRLDLVAGETGDLTTSGIDLAIRFGPQPSSAMSSLHLLETRVLTVASPDYIKRYGHPATPDALGGHECLHYIDPQRSRPFDWEFRRDGTVVPVTVSGRYSFIDVDAMVAAACAGTGIAQVLALGTERLIADGVLLEVFPGWSGETFPLYAVRPSRRLAPAMVEAFQAFCEDICRSRSGQADRIRTSGAT
jgi:DNA-binding transcriptional LysR family regulator